MSRRARPTPGEDDAALAAKYPIELDSSHVSMLSHPDAIASLILEAAGKS